MPVWGNSGASNPAPAGSILSGYLIGKIPGMNVPTRDEDELIRDITIESLKDRHVKPCAKPSDWDDIEKAFKKFAEQVKIFHTHLDRGIPAVKEL